MGSSQTGVNLFGKLYGEQLALPGEFLTIVGDRLYRARGLPKKPRALKSERRTVPPTM
jgi:hypothetical protein